MSITPYVGPRRYTSRLGRGLPGTPRHAAPAELGFTLIELLVVVIIIAILAGIAIPTYLGSRQKAQDSASVMLVRNALTAVEAANLAHWDYTAITVAELYAMEPSINWNVAAADLVDPTVPIVTGAVTAESGLDQVDFFGQSATSFDVASGSDSGNMFGIQVNTSVGASTDYIKVRVVDGVGAEGW